MVLHLRAEYTTGEQEGGATPKIFQFIVPL